MMNTQTSYDAVATEYAARIYDELRHKPLDRELLDQFATQVREHGLVCDLGCGPGQIARYLHERGVDIRGVDLSPAMVEQARQLNPDITFEQGDMRALPVADAAYAGIAAFYSLIHIPRADVVQVLSELWRVLQPGGTLLLSFHVGDEIRHMDEWWNQLVSVDFVFFQVEEMRRYLTDAGFAVGQVVERASYPGVEADTRRAYIFGTKA